MFSEAVKKVSKYTRSINTLERFYKSDRIIRGSSTLFFVNEDGYAITCKHILLALMAEKQLQKHYNLFKEERSKIASSIFYEDELKNLETRFKLSDKRIVEVKNLFVHCAEAERVTWIPHPTYDLAIIKFENVRTKHYQDYATFKKDSTEISQGNYLCRLGYPFAQFTNYTYSKEKDEITWIKEGRVDTPTFPFEGMVTRFLADNTRVYGIEMSTPGLKGQSGGPLFDKDGIVYGMQFRTRPHYLGFDIRDMEVNVGPNLEKVSNYPFLYLGECIHVDVIKEFLKANQIKFYER